MMRMAVLLGLALLLLAPPAPFALAQQMPANFLVVPGQRIGKWTLGMTISDLVRVTGPASLTQVDTAGEEGDLDARRNSWTYLWNTPGLGAQTFDKQSVAALIAGVSLSPPAYTTPQGINLLASTRADIVKTYGTPTVVLKAGSNPMLDLIYDKLGIAFRVMGGGEIRSIEIFRTGTAKTLWKF
jgi:hypothetical protein